MAFIQELISKYGSHAALIGLIVWLWRSRDDFRTKNASLEAQVDSLKERNSDFKDDSRKELDRLKAENLEIQKTIQEKYSDEAILAKYEFNQTGVPIHKTSKRPFCPACLHASVRREVPLGDASGDDYLRCSVERSHCFSKRNH